MAPFHCRLCLETFKQLASLIVPSSAPPSQVDHFLAVMTSYELLTSAANWREWLFRVRKQSKTVCYEEIVMLFCPASSFAASQVFSGYFKESAGNCLALLKVYLCQFATYFPFYTRVLGVLQWLQLSIW